ncbi:MAG: carboxypeptidase regulatory-like domain-containing protein [Candidatus Micrarchaeota archaeon]|nr:carboxypeptidase regulatory-like domain-containing protein [Candidatus Micrarchaeota archaeon]
MIWKELVAGIVLLVLAATTMAGSWSGYVVEQNTVIPVDQVTVSAIYAANGTVANTTLTNAAGFFNVSGLNVPAGGENYTLVFSKTGWTTTSYWGAPLTPARPDRYINPAFMNVTMTRAVPATLNGSVYNASGLLTGVSVTIDARQGAAIVNSTTTTNGAYSLALIDGTYNVTATAATGGYAPSTRTNLVLAPGENQTTDFTLGPSVFLTGVRVSPANPSIARGSTQQFIATALYSDNSTADVTASAAWSSSNPAVGTISAAGLFNAVAAGSSTVGATYNGYSDSTAATVYVPATPPAPPGGGGTGGQVGSCGDSVCSIAAGESCSTCHADCGYCAPTPTPNATVSATPSPTPSQQTGVIETQEYVMRIGVDGEAFELLVSRQLVIEPEPSGGYRSTIIITIKNRGTTPATDFEFRENIPAAFGNSNALTYAPQPARIVSGGAVWKVALLSPGDILTLRYWRIGAVPRSYMTLFGIPEITSTKPGKTATVVTQVETTPTPAPAPASPLSGFFTAASAQYMLAGAIILVIVAALAAFYLRRGPPAAPQPKEGLRGAAKKKHEERLRKLSEETEGSESAEAKGKGGAGKKAVSERIEKLEQALEELKKQL